MVRARGKKVKVNKVVEKPKAKPKASKPTTAKSERKDPRVERVYEEYVEFICPVRGKVRQKVKIKKYKTRQDDHYVESLQPQQNLVDKLDDKDDGLSIYGEPDEEGTK